MADGKFWALARAALITAVLTPACAFAESPAKDPPKHAAPAPAASKAAPNFEAIMGVIDKMFPPQPDPDPARLALARVSVQSMWPDGAYAKMMSSFTGNIFDGVMQLKKSDLASVANKTAKSSAGATAIDVTVHDQALAKDPLFDQRMAAMRGIIDEEFTKMSAMIDPRMREGLARSMARRLDGRQLADINAFFGTPSGHALASEYMQLWFEPDTLRSMMAAFPEMMKLMPEAMQKFKAVNDKFPKPPARQSKSTKL